MTDEPTIYAWLEQARAFAAQRKFLHAMQIYRRVTAEAPALEPAWVELAHVYLHLQRPDAAEKALLHALDLTRQPSQIVYFLASLHRETGNGYEALKYYRRLLALERTLSPGMRTQVHVDLGMLYRERKNNRMAEYHLRTAHRLNPRFHKVTETLAELLLQRGAVADAARFLQKALEVEPHSWAGHFLMGRIHARRNNWEEALEEFILSVDMDPDESRGWHMSGSALLALHRLDESERYLQKAVALNPKFADAYVDLGLVFVRRGETAQAQEYFLRALNVEPGNRRARDGQRELLRMRNAQ